MAGRRVGSPGVDLYAPLDGAPSGRQSRPHPVGRCPDTVTSCGSRNNDFDVRNPRMVVAGLGADRFMVLMGDVDRP